ncbi:MAG: hypothetical protein ACFFA0_07440 [Promethearchaeota archaeon]
MKINEIFRLTAGILCISVAILRVVLFFFNLSAAAVYSFPFIGLGEIDNIFEGIVLAFLFFFATIIITGIAVVIYVVLGILQIVLRKYKTPSIICNIITGISILFSIRVFIVFAIIDESSILLTILAIIYITIFSLCIISYIKFRKEV